jgi:hypothetical protein
VPLSAAGRVAVEGDARDVVLEAHGRRIIPGNLVPAGSYAVLATWDDAPLRTVGRIEVRPGEETRVRCSAFFYACTALAPTP